MIPTYLRPASARGRLPVLLLYVGWLCLIAASASARQEAPAPGSSVVRGRAVYEDTGKPMRYARVFLSDEKNRQRARITSTDGRGEFTFRDVAAGNYLASVLPPDAYGSNAFPVAPEGGEPVSADGTSAVELKLRGPRGGSITGKITYQDGEPVVAARVIVLRAAGGGWGLAGMCCTEGPMTDDRGVYRVYGLRPGEYKVGVSEEGQGVEGDGSGWSTRSNSSLVTVFYPAESGAETAASIKVSQGRAVEGIDIALLEVRAFTVSGVASLGGRPLRGMSLSLSRRDSPGYSPGHRSVTTDADGKWAFKSVPDGTYTVSTQPGAGPAEADPEKAARLRKAVRESRAVTVAGADVEGVTMAISIGGAINGTVVVEGGGARPGYMSLTAIPADEAVRGPNPDVGRGRVEPGGSFRLEGVRPGEVFVEPDSGIQAGYYVKSITWNGQDLIRRPLPVAEDGEVKGVRITLATDPGTLSGRMPAAEAGGPEGAGRCAVLLVPADPALWWRRWSYLWSAVSPEGKFAMKGAPGEYLVLSDTKFGNDPAQYIKEHAEGARRVTLRAREETKLELSRRCGPEGQPKQ